MRGRSRKARNPSGSPESAPTARMWRRNLSPSRYMQLRRLGRSSGKGPQVFCRWVPSPSSMRLIRSRCPSPYRIIRSTMPLPVHAATAVPPIRSTDTPTNQRSTNSATPRATSAHADGRMGKRREPFRIFLWVLWDARRRHPPFSRLRTSWLAMCWATLKRALTTATCV